MVIGVVVFFLVAYLLIKMLPMPLPVEVSAILKEDGLSPQEIRKELRAQRAEHRAHGRAVVSSLRTANRISRLAVSLSKKIK
jgi:DnaJ domain